MVAGAPGGWRARGDSGLTGEAAEGVEGNGDAPNLECVFEMIGRLIVGASKPGRICEDFS